MRQIRITNDINDEDKLKDILDLTCAKWNQLRITCKEGRQKFLDGYGFETTQKIADTRKEKLVNEHEKIDLKKQVQPLIKEAFNRTIIRSSQKTCPIQGE